ncbi:MAG: hypothetical protein KatS3mg051_1536 [Anaerolineae bacterium]|nr:MAG: hypothetical protein KatS3mg051_1536 [Anaerolineae bacterium]
MPALEWHDANPGAQYMVRWALLAEDMRVVEGCLNHRVVYYIQRRRRRWHSVGLMYDTLYEALLYAHRAWGWREEV